MPDVSLMDECWHEDWNFKTNSCNTCGISKYELDLQDLNDIKHEENIERLLNNTKENNNG